MDEAALRAMMPSAFGRRGGGGGGGGGGKRKAGSAGDGLAGGGVEESDGQSTVLGKSAQVEAEDEDDGLTAEERAANREAEEKERERRERGLASDDDDDDDSSNDYDDDSAVGPPAPPAHPSPSPLLPPSSLPPTTHTASFTNTHTKTLSALAVDGSGSRFALGSYDTMLSLYDFGGMTSALQPFRLFAPWETYPILDLSFNMNSTHLLVVSSTAEAKVFTRDGAELGTCRKGDPYLRDMRHTRGHVSGLTCGQFARHDASTFYTGGSDSTIRVWNTDRMHAGQEDVIVLKSRSRGGRTKVTALECDTAHRLWASGEDGSLGMWDLRSNLNSKPRGSVQAAHDAGTWTSAIAVEADRVVTRGGDATVKVWDVRALGRGAVVERCGLPGAGVHTGLLLDPFAARGIVTAVADASDAAGNNDDERAAETRAQGGGSGSIVVLDSLTLATVSTTRCPSLPIRLHWSAHTNQLFATHRSGTLSIFYHPSRSTNGVLLPLSRTAPSSLYTAASSLPAGGADSYPVSTDEMRGALSESAKRRRLARDRQSAQATRMPQPPLPGRGAGGRIGASATQHVVQSVFGVPQDLHDDPREALLKYATPPKHAQDAQDAQREHADEQDEYTKAWTKTQPKTLFSEHVDD
ncbi:hypothetical protein EX895_004771 [Sporisorium graminicola]|uniref:Uncharacterized protein n=1 Tax=Sporisorium graminicola TaxID=280036 RepID=A0A4U7KPR0_9BASI|nr:hypothetical protein EX895_004771 [Sporisorium graminicola]TKY85946.1 hypothetical protein EX895_004771 [Sporisorium graminicola]